VNGVYAGPFRPYAHDVAVRVVEQIALDKRAPHGRNGRLAPENGAQSLRTGHYGVVTPSQLRCQPRTAAIKRILHEGQRVVACLDPFFVLATAFCVGRPNPGQHPGNVIPRRLTQDGSRQMQRAPVDPGLCEHPKQ